MLQVARYASANGPRWGLVSGGELIPLTESFSTTEELLTHGLDAIGRAAADTTRPRVDLAGTMLLSPITENQQIVCQGVNYRRHMLEAGLDPDAKKFNMIFRKASSCLCGSGHPIERPPEVELLDYEIELGLVIGREISKAETFEGDELPEPVRALVIHNDVSARDIQVPQMQFYKGKSYRTFGPTGPFLTIVDDEVRRGWQSLRLVLTVNGEARQDAFASEMVFKPAETLTELSRVQSFRAGDLIATGTPSGVAMQLPAPWLTKLVGLLPEKTKWDLFRARQRQSGRYLSPGDLIEATIRTDDDTMNLGRLSNRVVDAQ